MKVDVIMGIDPGAGGALCVLINNSAVLFDTPTIKIEKGQGSKKRKMTYHDPVGTRDLLKPFEGQNVLFALEKVSPRPGEGVVSSFTFAQSYAFWKMAAVCFNFDLIEVTPATWKKTYHQLSHSELIENIREESKALRAKRKVLRNKKEKDSISKEISSLNRRLKAASKKEARDLAADLHPDLADKFSRVKDDGRAEALLIARYAQSIGSE